MVEVVGGKRKNGDEEEETSPKGFHLQRRMQAAPVSQLLLQLISERGTVGMTAKIQAEICVLAYNAK